MIDHNYTHEWFAERSISELRRYRHFLYFMLLDAVGIRRVHLERMLLRCRAELNLKTGETKYQMEKYVYAYYDDEGNWVWTADIMEAEKFAQTNIFEIEVLYEAV